MTGPLHELTCYTPEREWDQPSSDDPRVVQEFTPNDVAHLPRFYKHYDDALPTTPLPREWPAVAASVLDVLGGAYTAPPAEPNLPSLARVLYGSAGVTRTAERWGRRYPFRAAGSAGARFPLEVYVAVPESAAAALPPGVHWYHPADHALVKIGPAPQGDVPALVVTGLPWRTGWRYRERGFRHIYWDAGTLLSHVLALASSAGLGPRVLPVFPDAAVAALVGADGTHEFPAVVVALGEGTPALTPTAPAAPGQLDDDALEFPLVTAAQRAGDRDVLGAPLPAGDPVDVPGGGPSIDEAALARSSHRRLDPSAAVPRSALVTAMRAALRGIDVPHWVAVNAVDDMAPGVYRWPDLEHPVRTGELRHELWVAALEQGLARDAAFVAISAVPAASVDDRAYRAVQLQAGLAEGRLHLLAPALGMGANGMTFLDSEIPALLAEDDPWCLLWTCVGVPEYAPRTGGRPGAPTSITTVTPRD